MLTVLSLAKRFGIRIPKYICFNIIALSDQEFHYSIDLVKRFPYYHILPRAALAGNFSVVKKILSELPHLIYCCFGQICQTGNIEMIKYAMEIKYVNSVDGLKGLIRGGHIHLLYLFDETDVIKMKESLMKTAYKNGQVKAIELLVAKFDCCLDRNLQYANFSENDWALFKQTFPDKTLEKNQLLICYAAQGKYELVKNLLKENFGENTLSRAKYAALRKGHANVFNLFAGNKPYNFSFFMNLYRSNSIEFVKNIPDDDLFTKEGRAYFSAIIDLLLQVKNNSKEKVVLFHLLDRFKHFGYKFGISLNYATKSGYVEIVRYCYANQKVDDELSNQLFTFACKYGYLEIVQIIMKHGYVPKQFHYEIAINFHNYYVAEYIK